jgi:hypothetical protein
MCANCRTVEGCDCMGGPALATCSCESGYPCLVCGHEPAGNVAADPNLVVEMLSPDLQVGLE